MTTSVYYNEHDPFAAAWLRELIKAGQIALGEVDERSIEDVLPSDLKRFTQCHFFAGIGVWSYALRCAGWPDDRPVWTGSCPCQPFSSAGKRKGTEDERHLWPSWFRLIDACRPTVIFGEQVAAAGVVGKTSQKRSGLPTAISPTPSREGFDSTCESSGAEEGNGFRPGPACSRNSGADRCQSLRIIGAAVQSQGRENLGQSFTGQDESESWLRLRESAGYLPCFEQCFRGLGRTEIVRFDESDWLEAYREIERLIAEDGRQTESKNGPTWFDAVSIDLERAHYTIGACDSPAAGFGAPHIRQRLYWVANASGSGRRRRTALENRRLSELRGSSTRICRDSWPDGFGSRSSLAVNDVCTPSYGSTNRMGKLRGYGNALCAPVAQAFIESYLEVEKAL